MKAAPTVKNPNAPVVGWVACGVVLLIVKCEQLIGWLREGFLPE